MPGFTLAPGSGPVELRRWQREAVACWEAAGRPRDFLAEATPGAGKTTFALHLARGALAAGAVETLSVVCPTAHLRRQWQAAAHRAGIELATEVAAARPVRGFHGAALTYQQVLADPVRVGRALGSGWVVLDECHHAGEGRAWADALSAAFGDARHRLSLSGTAFRSDACRIPFIRYDGDGVSVADHRYGYGEALRDGVVRPVYFVGFGGETTWRKGGKVRRSGFDEILPRDEASARLRTALDPAGGWMGHALERAHGRLLEIRRRGHPDAGGLVLCMDQGHARRVAERLRELCGRRPALALSDDPGASAVISRFAAGREPWIVAVRQVSEGTDIPRLRVGLWATNATTELFFRQVVGRFVRVLPGIPDQDAFLYLPADSVLVRHARSLSEERSHALTRMQPCDPDAPRAPVVRVEEAEFRALGSSASEWGVVAGSRLVSPAELDRARLMAEACGIALRDPLPLVLALRDAGAPAHGESVPAGVRRDALRALLNRRVRELCTRTGGVHREVYARLKRRSGRPVAQLGEAALGRQIRVVEGWLDRAVERPHQEDRPEA